jgi:hypothetical protein
LEGSSSGIIEVLPLCFRLDGLGNTRKILITVSRCPVRKSNLLPPEYKSRAFLVRQLSRYKNNNNNYYYFYYYYAILTYVMESRLTDVRRQDQIIDFHDSDI